MHAFSTPEIFIAPDTSVPDCRLRNVETPTRLTSKVLVARDRLKGLMLVAETDFDSGDVVTEAMAFRISACDRASMRSMDIYKYVFVDPRADQVADQSGYIAFGPISLCNHASDFNAIVDWSTRGAYALLTMVAIRPIIAGSEVTMFYSNIMEYPGSGAWT